MSIRGDYEAILAGPWNDIQDHMQFMHDSVLRYFRPVVIECGVRTGNSTSALLSAVEEADGELWSCDINPAGTHPGGYVGVPAEWTNSPRWRFMQGDSVSAEVLSWMPEHADVVFIDTSHSFAQTLAELHAYVPRVTPGGVALLHDTQLAGNSQIQYFEPLPEVSGEVADALNEYERLTGTHWENRQSGPGWYGMGVIRG